MSELPVVFRTRSGVEANVVRALLETQGISGILTVGGAPAAFPLDGLAEVRLSVRPGDARRAERVIADYRDEVVVRVGSIRDEFAALEARLSYTFADRGLLERALTHRSRAHDDPSGGVVDNESLEFLGDAVLGLVVADRLFREFPDDNEGRKSKVKAQLVSAPTLARLGTALQLGEHLLLGRGEEKTGGRQKPSLLADTFEAVVAAIYLDGGYAAAAAFVEREFLGTINQIRQDGVAPIGTADHKSTLQEWLQGHGHALPHYRVARTSGPDHEKTFVVDVVVGGEVVASGEGRSKKDAEQIAAHRALAILTS